MSEKRRLATIEDFAPGSDKRIWCAGWYDECSPLQLPVENSIDFDQDLENLGEAVAGLADGTTYVLGDEEPGLKPTYEELEKRIAELEKEKEDREAEPREMALCESRFLILRKDTPYIFREMEGCKQCRELAAEYEEAEK
jgi:hypothetical protein